MAAGCSLALLLDQRARVKPVIASFFGRPACCDRSAGVLLRRLGVPIVFGTAWREREPLSWTLRLGPVLHPEEVRGLAPESVAERVNRELERIILREPEQVFWLHDRYRDAPARLAPSEPGPP
ncbi:MAG TPA: hypothetical protein VJP77_09145 [Planctomycetota bacterium]|nr:hypothetical protein [Planctomycetota bacterium]